MLLHSVPRDSKGLEGRSLLDFFTEEDRARISQQFQSSISSETTSVMALNADMFDSDQNRVKVELFHAQFQNLAHQRCFLVGVREIQVEDAMGTVVPANTATEESSGELWALFHLPSFEILVLSADLEQLCQNYLGQIPENILDMSCPSCRSAFYDTMQALASKSWQGHLSEQGKEETFQFNLLGAGCVTASFALEQDEFLNTMVGSVNIFFPPALSNRSRPSVASLQGHQGHDMVSKVTSSQDALRKYAFWMLMNFVNLGSNMSIKCTLSYFSFAECIGIHMSYIHAHSFE